MAMAGRWTLTRYLIEERRRFPQASGDLNALILDIAPACKAIARIVAKGGWRRALQGRFGAPAAGPRQQRLFIRMNEWSGQLRAWRRRRWRPVPVPACARRTCSCPTP